MTVTSSAFSLCLLITTLGPCSAPPPVSPELATENEPLAPQRAVEPARELPKQQTQTEHTFMQEHAREAHDLRRGVIAGRFDLIHRVSAVMADDAWSRNLRPDYLPHVTAVRRAARSALDARSMPAAGAALGELGAACAACHREHGGPRESASVEPLTDGVGTMAIHAAAEQALWQGLFTPSEASWKRGADRLAGAPELASDVEDVAALGRQLRDLAQAAATSPGRGDLYGSIMATCSTCHRRLSIQPR